MKIILGSAVCDLHEESVTMHEIFQIAWKAKMQPHGFSLRLGGTG